MAQDNADFVNGLIVKAPREGAPEYVKASLSIKREELIAWLQSREGEWINVDVKEARSGKWYAAVNAWKPPGDRQRCTERPQHMEQRQRPASRPASPQPATRDFEDDDIPF